MSNPPISAGKILAIVSLVLAVVFLAVGKLTMIDGGLFALLSIAVLLI